MPLDQRSALPTVPGVPAWGAVVVAAGLTFIGFALDAMSGSELTSTFSILYFFGCVLAVLAVRYRGMFTAVVQPPLLLFVAVPIAQQVFTGGTGTGLKDLALNVAYPLVNRFPLMLVATLVVGLIAGARVFLVRQGKGAPARSRARRTQPRTTRDDSSTSRREAPTRSPRATSRRDERTRRDDHARDDYTRGDDYETPMDRRPRRRAPVNDQRPPRPTHEPVTAHVSGYGGRDNGYREPVRREGPRRETVYGEPIARDREPIQRDPIPVRSRPPMDMPPRPAPQVRYRERREPPFDG
ncbi:hypothetical protein M2280_004775 [Prescottella agglutinans]|uniref:DUF6542 domain-containing protein n=1 Tax=Prescottella agglutinans TaxID=1644129 RepID=A0ABT6MGS0_9NOCA|nr:hypothetical protein [Prescottella agglutinans]